MENILKIILYSLGVVWIVVQYICNPKDERSAFRMSMYLVGIIILTFQLYHLIIVYF